MTQVSLGDTHPDSGAAQLTVLKGSSAASQKVVGSFVFLKLLSPG